MVFCFLLQIVFRKICDVKREEEERLKRKDEAPLNFPPDHPVRRLFQRFRQQREARLAAERARQALLEGKDIEKGSIQSEQTALVCEVIPATSVITVAESPSATPITSASSSSSGRLSGRAKLDAPYGTPDGLKSAELPKGRGWSRFKEAPGKREPPHHAWVTVAKAESMETLPDRTKSHEEVILLKKTDSCDSGITKSDLRLDSVGDGVSQTPQDCSPVQAPAPVAGTEAGGEGRRGFQASAAQLDVQTALFELRQELRGEMRALSGRIAAMEGQLAEMLRLLHLKTTSVCAANASTTTTTTPSIPEPLQMSDKEDALS